MRPERRFGAPVTIRAMWPADIPDVMRIERQSFGMPWQESTFRALMRRPSASLLTAEADGAVVGFAVLWFVEDEGELGDLAVDPGHRGRGIGRTLLDRSIEEARLRGARTLYLEVRESNEAARALYETAGFDPVGRRTGYYSGPREDACVMMLDLQNSVR